jgi:dipeptidase E
MRLYLSSYRVGDRAGALLALLGNGRRGALIENALDNVSRTARELFRSEVHDPVAEFTSLGIELTRIDLRDHFGGPGGLAEALRQFDLVWVVGGNSFVLRRAMRASGFDEAVVPLVEDDAIVYGGFSAGAVVAAPSLRGLELMDDPHEVPDGYPPEVVWEGLGLIDHVIVPHYRSEHPESRAAERTVRYLSGRGLRYRTLRDGEAVVWTEDRRRVGGDPGRRIA